MRLIVNGETLEMASGCTVKQLLAQFDFDKRPVAVERNRDIVRFKTFDETILQDGDILEIVALVGGG